MILWMRADLGGHGGDTVSRRGGGWCCTKEVGVPRKGGM